MLSYFQFAISNFRMLSFGIILMVLSSPGLTYFFSLFILDFRTYFELTDGQLGTVFSIATMVSAVALSYFGQFIDRVRLTHFTLVSGSLLILSCIMMGVIPPSILLFTLCIFCLRLTAQGLMVHISMTTMVRHFSQDSGKAIAMTGLVNSAVLIIIPIIVVISNTQYGWQKTWIVAGALCALLIAVSLSLLSVPLREEKQTHQNTRLDDAHNLSTSKNARLSMLIFVFGALLSVSFIFTGLLFHQLSLASEKGWGLSWMAISFSVFAVAQAMSSLILAPAIDKYGSLKFLPYYLLPLALGLFLIIFIEGNWVAPVYMALVGISAAVDIKFGTMIWREIYGSKKLGTFRARFEGLRIIMTGIAPLVMGFLLDINISLTVQAVVYLAFILIVSAGLYLILPSYISGELHA